MSEKETVKKFVEFLKSKNYNGDTDKEGKEFNKLSNEFGMDSSFVFDNWPSIEKEMKNNNLKVVKENVMANKDSYATEAKETYATWLRKNTAKLRTEYRNYLDDMKGIEEEPLSFEEWTKESYDNMGAMNESKNGELEALIKIVGGEDNLKNILDDPEEIEKYYDDLYDYYSDEMPYGTAKARTGDPYEWMWNKIFMLLQNKNKNEAWNVEKTDVITLTDKIKDMSPQDKKVYDGLTPEQKKTFDSLLSAIRNPVRENELVEKIEKKLGMEKSEPISEARSLLKDAPDVQDKPKDADDIEPRATADAEKPAEKLSKDEPVSDEEPEAKEEPVADEEPEAKEEPVADEEPEAKEEPKKEVNEGAFSKQHYIAIANILKDSESKEEIVKELVDYFKKDNPRFDNEKFIEYIGISK